MRQGLAFAVAVALWFAVGGCSGGVDAPVGEGFSLVGLVTDTDVGAEPGGVPIDEDIVGDDRGPDDRGTLVVRPDEDETPTGLRGCLLGAGTHTVFFTEQTDFDPADTVDAREFPASVVGSTVDVRGLVYPNRARDERSSCTIVARRVVVIAD